MIDSLKDTLEIIDHNTPLKDADYWDFYEAIELFLYGERKETKDGKIWGISNFYSIWESMCLTYICNDKDFSNLLHLDTKFLSKNLVEKINYVTKKINLSNTFKINNYKVNPDAVILKSVLRNVPKRQYNLLESNWNDHGYYTTFKEQDETKKKWYELQSISIGYVNQTEGNHTINELKKFYSLNERILIISEPLPQKFYSFWTTPETLDNLDKDEVYKMYYFNHIFLIAALNNYFSWEIFKHNILTPLGVTEKEEDNVFQSSLFRVYNMNRIKEMFELFIKSFLSLFQLGGVDIYDIKYLSYNYFKDESRRQELKERSIRKQFLYEYLIQKQLEKNKDQYSNLKIQSKFWIPGFRLDSFNEPLNFMDDYIELWKIDFETVANEYIYGEM
ncbi:MAG: hypothetical protein AB4063_08730 [Crocosphaera sp.]